MIQEPCHRAPALHGTSQDFPAGGKDRQEHGFETGKQTIPVPRLVAHEIHSLCHVFLLCFRRFLPGEGQILQLAPTAPSNADTAVGTLAGQEGEGPGHPFWGFRAKIYPQWHPRPPTALSLVPDPSLAALLRAVATSHRSVSTTSTCMALPELPPNQKQQQPGIHRELNHEQCSLQCISLRFRSVGLLLPAQPAGHKRP